MAKLNFTGPVVLAVLDGVGLSAKTAGNAAALADTPFLDYALTHYLNVPLEASGPAVGILPGQAGNSEAGHNAIGAGQTIKQGIARVEAAFSDKSIFQTPAWRSAIDFFRNSCYNKKIDPTFHFLGILSDGGVHSDIKHLEQLIAEAYAEGVRKIRLHAIFDGRDVAPQSEPKYIQQIEMFAGCFPDLDFAIASGCGRMVATTDRYESDWPMVQKGWDMMTRSRADFYFKSAADAITYFRFQNPELQDQYLPTFVIVKDNRPVGQIRSGDVVVNFDFRADRAVEISRAFTESNFSAFDRGATPEIFYVGLTEYDSTRHIPQNILVPPTEITLPLSEFLSNNHISQLAVAETVKFGHITYYFNGNRRDKFPGETWVNIPSDQVPFNQAPAMKAKEITDYAIANLNQYRFVRINYANGDMVGHFGELKPAMLAMETVDHNLKRLAQKVNELGGILLITADHGNIEQLTDENGQPKTSHSTNKVPCVFYDNTENRKLYHYSQIPDPNLTNLAATVATLLDLPYPKTWNDAIIKAL